jgi:hypothetical protein
MPSAAEKATWEGEEKAFWGGLGQGLVGERGRWRTTCLRRLLQRRGSRLKAELAGQSVPHKLGVSLGRWHPRQRRETWRAKVVVVGEGGRVAVRPLSGHTLQLAAMLPVQLHCPCYHGQREGFVLVSFP